jgi:hypothetical protein
MLTRAGDWEQDGCIGTGPSKGNAKSSVRNSFMHLPQVVK